MMAGLPRGARRVPPPRSRRPLAEPTPDPTRPAEPDLAAENIQARIRGTLLMALSNKFGGLVLTTGNKSEMSVGYCTLYGDMAGGFAVINDVPKTLVYELVERRNERAGRDLIPAAVIEQPPSAELRPDQLDSDSLPHYDVLDRDPRGLRRARPVPRRDGRGRPRRRGRRRGDPPGRPRRVQAPPGRPRHPHHPTRLRPRPAPADHQPLRRLTAPLRASAPAGPPSSSWRARRSVPRRRRSRPARPRCCGRSGGRRRGLRRIRR